MQNVICFGEALIDMLSTEPGTFKQFPGGAPANAAVAIAKMGGNAIFSGMLGNDMFGKYLHQSLNEYAVNTEFVRWTDQAKTALAFVSLDAEGERSFEFYRPPAADLLFRPNDFDLTMFQQSTIFHFCSNSLTDESIANSTKHGITLATQNDCLVSMDVNLRKNLWPATADYQSIIIAYMEMAHVIKVSLEELEALVDKADIVDFLQTLLTQKCQLVMLTDGANPIICMTKNTSISVTAPEVIAVDTTAAGDAFIGGFLYQLNKQNISLINLDTFVCSEKLTQAVQFAACCGAYTVNRQGAFPALPDRVMAEKFERQGQY
jgi:fructokinase